MLIRLIDEGEGLPQVKQVSSQISLKRKPIERVVLLCSHKDVERLVVFAVGRDHTNSAKHSQE